MHQKQDRPRLVHAKLDMTQSQPSFALVPEYTRTPISFGVMLEGGHYHEMIRPNTGLPHTSTEVFVTAIDYIRVARLTVACSQSILRPPSPITDVEIEGVQWAEEGIPQAKVTMSLDTQLHGDITIVDQVTLATAQKAFNGNLFIETKAIELGDVISHP